MFIVPRPANPSLQLRRSEMCITSYTQLTGFVVQGPRASQCLTLSENF